MHRLSIRLWVVVGVLLAVAAAHAATPPGIREIKDLAYVTGGTPAQRLDLYLPADAGPAKQPLVVWIHGGGWMGGSKASVPLLGLVTQGYDVASVEYRFSQVALFPAQIQDCQAAIRWLRAHAEEYGFDSAHIGVGGDSAGGHLVLLLGMTGGKNVFPKIGGNEDQSDRVQAVCDFYGPADFNTVLDQFAHSPTASVFHFNGGDPYSRLTGTTLGTDKAKADVVSPVHYVTPGVPPVLILHGTNDALVPFAQSEELLADLRAVRVDAYLQHFPGSGHGGRMFGIPPVRQLVQTFFDKYLKGKEVTIELLPDSVVTLRKVGIPATQVGMVK
jgi:acetyl esterase/lipase